MAEPEPAGREVMSDQAEDRPPQGQVRIEKLYLKDASFESPNTPSMFQQEWKPEIELNINTRSEQVAPSYPPDALAEGQDFHVRLISFFFDTRAAVEPAKQEPLN